MRPENNGKIKNIITKLNNDPEKTTLDIIFKTENFKGVRDALYEICYLALFENSRQCIKKWFRNENTSISNKEGKLQCLTYFYIFTKHRGIKCEYESSLGQLIQNP